MKVNVVSANYFPAANSSVLKKNQPSFQASLNISSDLSSAYHYMGGNISWFNMRVRQAAKYIETLPNKPIVVTLSEAASKAVKKGRAPKDPALEVFIGKYNSDGKYTVESPKIAANLVSKYFEDEVYKAAKTLLA